MLRYQFKSESLPEKSSQIENTFDEIRKDTIGSAHSSGLERDLIRSPLDQRNRSIVYADWTASGRSLKSIESFISNRVLPWYGNTHSVSSATARQTTHFREEARHIIRNYFNCTEANAVMFVGAGVTGAINKFMAVLEEGVREKYLGSRVASHIGSFLVEDRWGSLVCSLCEVRVKNEAMFRSHCSSAMHHSKWLDEFQESDDSELKIHIILDCMSHHSSILPFRELARRHPSCITLSTIRLAGLDSELRKIPESTIPVAVFCAMSNITGEGPSLEEIECINELIHMRKGLVAWDLATFACHEKFDMNPVGKPLGYSDFAFVSSHKLIGGPGAAGLLLARREWLKNSIPTCVGGGVVFFASAEEESYIQNSEDREEAGTPDILGCIRAGLVFHLHSSIDLKLAKQKEMRLANILRDRLKAVPNVVLLGTDPDVVTPIISFNIKFKPSPNLLLHHEFVVAVLNDLFGVQARGGCACAGPFAQRLLGLDEVRTHKFHTCLQQSGQEIFRPGFTRVSLHWSMSEQEVVAIANGIEWISIHGSNLLSAYKVDVQTGEWKHRGSNHEAERVWMSNFNFHLEDNLSTNQSSSADLVELDQLVDAADKTLETIKASADLVREARLDERFKDLIWFALPSDSKRCEPTVPIISPRTKNFTEKKIQVTSPTLPEKKKRRKFETPKKLRSLVTSALSDFSMLKEGDRVLIGISGGKDSLSLLHLLMDIKRKCPFNFEIACATVDPQVAEYQPRPLIQYMESLGIEYHYLSSPIVEIAKTAMKGKQSICAFCSRMKRGMLYRCMRDHKYNVLALGQHLDDLVESFLMSCFRNGALRTMKANYFVKEKDLRVIRPLVYVREKMTSEFANEAKLPVIRDNCPACFAAPKERHRVKMLLSHEEFENPHLFASMLQAMKPLIGISTALSTRQLIDGKLFPIGNIDEDDDQGAEDVLLPCTDTFCPISGE